MVYHHFIQLFFIFLSPTQLILVILLNLVSVLINQNLLLLVAWLGLKLIWFFSVHLLLVFIPLLFYLLFFLIAFRFEHGSIQLAIFAPRLLLIVLVPLLHHVLLKRALAKLFFILLFLPSGLMFVLTIESVLTLILLQIFIKILLSN